MPYHLPDDPDVSELDCVLVYFPNAPKYRQALFGQLAELTDVWNWEGTREEQLLARVAWLAAERETLNNMTCFDDVLAELQAINAKLPWCCDDGTAWSEGVSDDAGGTTIYPTPGPAPLPIPDTDFGTDDYPITPVTDPDDDGIVTSTDWEQYLCGAVNYLVDSVIDYLRFVRFQRSFTSSFLGVIRWLQARLAGVIVPGAIDDFALWELNDLLDEVINAFENVPIAVIDQAIVDLENIRGDIYCIILGENVAQNAIDAALTLIFGAVDNALAQSLIGNPVALFASLIWNGALDVAWRADCECFDLVIDETFDASIGDDFVTNYGTWESGGYMQIHSRTSPKEYIQNTVALLQANYGMPSTGYVILEELSFVYRVNKANDVETRVYYNADIIDPLSAGNLGDTANVWLEKDYAAQLPVSVPASNFAIRISLLGTGLSGDTLDLDSIHIRANWSPTP